jgi:hypothetical protein
MNQTNWEKIEKEFEKSLPLKFKDYLGTAHYEELKRETLSFFRQTLTTLIEECEPEKKIIKPKEDTIGIDGFKKGFNSGIKEYRENLLKAIK